MLEPRVFGSVEVQDLLADNRLCSRRGGRAFRKFCWCINCCWQGCWQGCLQVCSKSVCRLLAFGCMLSKDYALFLGLIAIHGKFIELSSLSLEGERKRQRLLWVNWQIIFSSRVGLHLVFTRTPSADPKLPVLVLRN